MPTALGTMRVLWGDVPQCIRSTCVKLMLAFKISDNGNCGQKQSWVAPFSGNTPSSQARRQIPPWNCSKMSKMFFLKKKENYQQQFLQQPIYRLYMIYYTANRSFSNNVLNSVWTRCLYGTQQRAIHKQQPLAQLGICLPKDQKLCSDKVFGFSV